MPSSHLILCRPLLLLPPIFPSIRVFSNESAFHIRWPVYYAGLITELGRSPGEGNGNPLQYSCLEKSHGAARQASLSITSSQSSLNLVSTESVMPSNHLILCRPLFLLPLIFPSIRVFSNESVFHMRWPKYWSFSLSISPSSGYSGLISFRMDWLDLLAVQGTLKSLLQRYSSKASILLHSVFFIV